MVLGLCRLLLRDPVEAEDAAQQTFLSAHRAVLSGVVPREPAAWLAAIARNECRARARARMREPLPETEVASDLPDPLAAAIGNADLDAVWAAISELPRRQRRAFLLREVGGLSYQELGVALGVSRPTVESLLFRARQNLRQVLATVNGFLVPLSLRDELARLIPGFDPAGAAAAARVAAIPIAAKLAAAGVGVGLVTAGAVELPGHHQRAQARPPVVVPAPVAARGGPDRTPRQLAMSTLTPAIEPARAQQRRRPGKAAPRQAAPAVAAEPEREVEQAEAPDLPKPQDVAEERGKRGRDDQDDERGSQDRGENGDDHGGHGDRGGGDGDKGGGDEKH